MSDNKLNLVIDQGATFQRVLSFATADGTPISLSGNTFAGQIRATHASTATLASFAFTSVTDNSVRAKLTNIQTAAIPAGDHVYDIERTLVDGTVSRVMYGKAKVMPEVTR